MTKFAHRRYQTRCKKMNVCRSVAYIELFCSSPRVCHYKVVLHVSVSIALVLLRVGDSLVFVSEDSFQWLAQLLFGIISSFSVITAHSARLPLHVLNNAAARISNKLFTSWFGFPSIQYAVSFKYYFLNYHPDGICKKEQEDDFILAR